MDFQAKKRILSIHNSASLTDPPSAVSIPFEGTYEDAINYESVSVLVKTNTFGTLTIKFAVSPLDPNPQEVAYNHTGGQKIYETPINARYLKVSYVDSSTVETLLLSTYLNPWAVKSSADGDFNLADPSEGHLDLFGRLRVSTLETLVDIKHITGLGLNTLYVASYIDGAGASQTLDANAPVVHMNVTSGSDSVIRQTRSYMQYQPGKSLLFYMTGRIITDLSANQVSTKIGYYDDYNGVFFSYNEGVMCVGIRTSTSGTPSTTFIPYTDWNQDKLDGTGVSGINVDWSKTLIYTISMAWLGVGVIRFGVIWGGTYYPAHIIYNIDKLTTYTANCNLPIRYSINSTGGAGQMDMICASASSEAGYSIRGLPFASTNGTKTVTTTETYLFAIRLKQDYRTIITINNATILCNSGGNIEVSIYRYLENNPLTGATWVSAHSLSAMESSSTGTWTKGTPILLYKTYISGADLVARLDLSKVDPIFITAGVRNGVNFASDVLLISAKKVTTTGADRDVEIAIGWTETI